MWCWSSMKGICLSFFSLSTSEQEEVVVVVGGRGAVGVCGLPLYPLTRAASFVRYYQCRVSPSLCLFFFFVCLFFWGGGGRGVCGCRGWLGERRQLNLPGVWIESSQAFTHISKYENIDSDTDSVFTLDSAFKFSRNVTKPELVWVFSQIHYLDSWTRFDLNCFREFSENIQRKARKVIFIEGG